MISNVSRNTFTLFSSGKTWEGLETEFTSFYVKDVIYIAGPKGPNFGYEKLITLGKQRFDGKAQVTMDKIEARDDGVFMGGWVAMPGVVDTAGGHGNPDDGEKKKGTYFKTVSQLKDGKFIVIKKIGTTA